MEYIYRCGVNPEFMLFKNNAVLCTCCGGIPLNPHLCSGCNKLIGKECIETIKPYLCPSCKCTTIPRHYICAKKLISEMEIIHIFCTQKLKLDAYPKHIATCKSKIKYKCYNENCKREIPGEPLVMNNRTITACSLQCIAKIEYQELIKQRITNYQTILEDVFGIVDENLNLYAHRSVQIGSEEKSRQSIPNSLSNVAGYCEFLWDPNYCSDLKITNGGKDINVNDLTYTFRNVLADRPFKTVGIYYWEIKPTSETENEIKVGVTGSRTFDPKVTFCDQELGFAYYGLSQLRHGSNTIGGKYGKPFKNAGSLGILLNMFEVKK